MRVASTRYGFGILGIDGLQLAEGAITWRMKITKLAEDDLLQIGVAFRIQDEPDPDGHPAQHVYVSVGHGALGDGVLVWHSVFRWDWGDDLPPFPGVPPLPAGVWRETRTGGGRHVPIPGWPAAPVDVWIEGRIELRGGAHEVYLGIREPPRRILNTDAVRLTTVGPGPGLANRKPVAEWISEGHPNFGVGGVGIYVKANPHPGNDGGIEVAFDDFKVDVVRTASPRGRLATTWAALRAATP